MENEENMVDSYVLDRLNKIVQECIPELKERGDLDTRNNDSEDFFETSIWSLRAALIAAYQSGCESVLSQDIHMPSSLGKNQKAETHLLKNFEMNTISVNDVLHALRECDRNERYGGMFEHMLTFASELTGISEDILSSSMYDVSVKSWEDVQRKYPIDRQEMDEDKEIRFVEDCFSLYEKEGFSSVYWSPFSDFDERKGQRFEVHKRCTLDDRDLCTLPMWKIKFPDGKVIDAYPEEIIPSEMCANGCKWFDEISGAHPF